MYERMLNKQVVPSIEEMTAYRGENAALFTLTNKQKTLRRPSNIVDCEVHSMKEK